MVLKYFQKNHLYLYRVNSRSYKLQDEMRIMKRNLILLSESTRLVNGLTRQFHALSMKSRS